jgi:AraC-like DNA-binding protein
MTSALSLPSGTPSPLPLPELRRIGAPELPLRVEPLALLSPLEGDAVVLADGERFRLRTGELLVVRSAVPIALERASADARILAFSAVSSWVEAFRLLHGEAAAEAPRALDLVPAGTTLARRAAQLFVGQRLQASDGALPASTTAALLEVIDEAQGSPLDPRDGRRRAGSRREQLVSALADYDPEADDDFSLGRLAERLGLSERQTARLVRAETGRSFRELKTATRLERAQKLLASSELPILEVALRAGWNSASQFHEAFRGSVGMSPARYRAAHRP